jgi:glycosyltransferase involved in cell wall biosynthesis
VSCDSKRPLVTLALLSFNQEKFILDAVTGALAQTYSPLEIIISDDHSTDSTFKIIKSLTEKYCGPHELKIVQNEHNLGIGQHINKIMQMAGGEIIIASAGDDISHSDRVETIVAEWVSASCAVDMLHSQVTTISHEGMVVQEAYSANYRCSSITEFIDSNVIIGASEAWTRRLYAKFGPLMPEVVHEDRAIGFRALLCGGIKFIDKPLVKYRLGGMSQICYKTTNELLYDVARITNKRYMDDFRQNLADLLVVDPGRTQYSDMADLISRRIKYHEARYLLASRKGVISTLARFNLMRDPLLLIEALKYQLPWAYSFYIWTRSRL